MSYLVTVRVEYPPNSGEIIEQESKSDRDVEIAQDFIENDVFDYLKNEELEIEDFSDRIVSGSHVLLQFYVNARDESDIKFSARQGYACVATSSRGLEGEYEVYLSVESIEEIA